MTRISLATAFLGMLLAVGCSNSPASYPDAPNTEEARKEQEAQDKKVDDAERGRG